MNVRLEYYTGTETISEERIGQYMYLGANSLFAYQVEQQITSASKLEYNKSFVEIQYNYRDKYLNFVDGFEQKQLGDQWWKSRLSGKNPWISKFFLRFCLLKVAQLVILDLESEDRNEDFLIVVDDEAIYLSLQSLLEMSPLSWTGSDASAKLKRNRKQARKTAWLRRILALPKYFMDKYLANKWFGKTELNDKVDIIGATFTDARSYRGGEYRDPFVGNILNEVKDKTSGIVLFPIIFDFKFNDRSLILNWTKKNNFHMFLPVQFVSYFKIVQLYFKAVFKSYKRATQVLFEGMDVSNLINTERREEWAEFQLQLPILSQAFQRIAKDYDPSVMIIPFENQLWERSVVKTLKRAKPEIKILGFQNAPASLLSIRYFNSFEIGNQVPLPDTVLANGQVSFENLEKNYPEKVELIKSSSIRANAEKSIMHKFDSSKPKNVMIACSISVNESIELINFVVKACRGLEACDVSIVPHPLAKFNYKEFVKNLEIENVIITEKGYDYEFQQADVVVYDSSTVGLEALQKGKLVVNVCHTCSLYVNPNEYDEKVTRVAYKPGDLREILSNSLDYDQSGNEKIADAYFGFSIESKGVETILNSIAS